MGQTEHKNIKIRSRKDLEEAIRERTRPLLEVGGEPDRGGHGHLRPGRGGQAGL